MKIKELIDQENKEIVIQGFVDNIRNLQYVQFVILRDKFDKVQITIEKEDENNKELVKIIVDMKYMAILVRIKVI